MNLQNLVNLSIYNVCDLTIAIKMQLSISESIPIGEKDIAVTMLLVRTEANKKSL